MQLTSGKTIKMLRPCLIGPLRRQRKASRRDILTSFVTFLSRLEAKQLQAPFYPDKMKIPKRIRAAVLDQVSETTQFY